MIVVQRAAMKPHFLKELKNERLELFFTAGLFGKTTPDLLGHSFRLSQVGLEIKIFIVQPGDQEGRFEQVDRAFVLMSEGRG